MFWQGRSSLIYRVLHEEHMEVLKLGNSRFADNAVQSLHFSELLENRRSRNFRRLYTFWIAFTHSGRTAISRDLSIGSSIRNFECPRICQRRFAQPAKIIYTFQHRLTFQSCSRSWGSLGIHNLYCMMWGTGRTYKRRNRQPRIVSLTSSSIPQLKLKELFIEMVALKSLILPFALAIGSIAQNVVISIPEPGAIWQKGSNQTVQIAKPVRIDFKNKLANLYIFLFLFCRVH